MLRRVLEQSARSLGLIEPSFRQVEMQREVMSVVTLSKFLAEETLSSHTLLAARPEDLSMGNGMKWLKL